MKKSQMARILEFDREVRAKRYPNRKTFTSTWGCRERTISRDIEYIRDTLRAPLEFDTNRRGYYYLEPWSLPSIVTASAIHDITTVAKEELVRSFNDEFMRMDSNERRRLLLQFTQADQVLNQHQVKESRQSRNNSGRESRQAA